MHPPTKERVRICGRLTRIQPCVLIPSGTAFWSTLHRLVVSLNFVLDVGISPPALLTITLDAC